MKRFYSCILLTLFTIIPLTISLKNVGETVHHFSGEIDGANPESSLIEVNNTGILYGVARHGGNSSDDLGVIYRINTTSNDTFTVVYQFTAITGCQPVSPLIFDGGVFLFGSTIRCSQFGYGNVFRFNLSDYKFEIIYGFRDLSNPGSLFLDKKTGLLYGTAGAGSTTYYGSAFTINVTHETPSATFKQLFSFNYRTGAFPSNLIKVNDTLYINTEIFGEFGGGTLVEMDLNGQDATLIHAFGDKDDIGCCPWGKLVLVTNEQQQQYLYGTTMGAAGCLSAIYRVGLTMMTNEIELVATFNDTTTGSGPFNGLIQSVNSSLLYGVTYQGAMNNNGAVFRVNINDSGKIEKLFDLPPTDTFGNETIGGLIEVGKSSLYGVARAGGKYGFGTVYKITLT